MTLSPDETAAERTFAQLARRFEEDPEIEQGRAFRSTALKVNGKIFAMLVDDELVVKLPAGRCVELAASDAARPFESGGRRMREWVTIEDADQRRWPDLADQALDFVRE